MAFGRLPSEEGVCWGQGNAPQEPWAPWAPWTPWAQAPPPPRPRPPAPARSETPPRGPAPLRGPAPAPPPAASRLQSPAAGPRAQSEADVRVARSPLAGAAVAEAGPGLRLAGLVAADACVSWRLRRPPTPRSRCGGSGRLGGGVREAPRASPAALPRGGAVGPGSVGVWRAPREAGMAAPGAGQWPLAPTAPLHGGSCPRQPAPAGSRPSLIAAGAGQGYQTGRPRGGGPAANPSTRAGSLSVPICEMG